tara:strand:- start:395 stop:1255 length:861 start_codon:yes stop_codon:yes gene_type:complete
MNKVNKESIVWVDGSWHEGSYPVMSAMSQSYMHGSTVFDGARAFNNCVPDLDMHCARLIHSADVMGLKLSLPKQKIIDLCIEGIKFFEKGAELYVRPSVFANTGFLIPEPDSSKLIITIFRAPMPSVKGFTAMISSYRRPHPDMAPTLAKASCLYANTSMALREAKNNGYDNVVMRDGEDNVVEFGSANLFLVHSGKILTPKWNKTFLNGITKKRVIGLLKKEKIHIKEESISVDQLLSSEEVFSTGNFGKVLPVRKINDKKYEIGKFCKIAMKLYQDFSILSQLN